MEASASRNAPCPCGSGKRYKECHGAIGAMRRAPAPFDERLGAALRAQQAGKLEAAADLYEQVLRDVPQSFDALHMLAVVRYQQGAFEPALDLIERALALQPDNPAVLLNRRLIDLGLERRPVADELVRDSVRAHVPHRLGMDITSADASVRVIAFYLPQYHVIPENDAWWGQGFTEWTNVRRACPLFDGHWQPHEPGELGYYELTDAAVRERQSELARAYGVDAFCYYHYWFGGKTLLEQPLNAVLATGKPDLPFCICWANENWTRRWDGLDQDVLIAQSHSREDSLAFVRSLYPFFRDRRYVRVNGRPLLLVYKIADIPDVASTVTLWREAARSEGIGELYLAEVQRHAADDPTPLGFDAAVEFPPIGHVAENATSHIGARAPEFRGTIFEYKSLAAHYLALPRPDFHQFRGVTPMWDNTARRQKEGMVIHGSTPEMFRVWLEYALRQTRLRRKGDERLLFVNAWNEWAEGCHLEPDARHGRRYLESVRDARAVERESPPSRPSMKQTLERTNVALQAGDITVKRFGYTQQNYDATDGVSIVMPVYNHRQFLARTLHSIAAQSLAPAELIAVDDGSRDDSSQIIEAFARSSAFPVTLVRQRNGGAHAAINRGMALARQDVVALINSDDMFVPQRLAVLTAALNDATAVAFSGTQFIDDADMPANSAYVQRLQNRIVTASAVPSLLYALVLENIAVSTGNLVFRRSLLDVLGGFAPLVVCHDWDFILAATYATRIAFVPEALYRYRLHGDNAFSASRLAGRWEGELVLDAFFSDVARHPWLTDATRPAFFAHVRAAGLGGYLPVAIR